MDIDEARRDGPPGRIDGPRGRLPGEPPHRRDLPLPNPEIADVRWIPSAVDDPSTANDNVKILRRRRSGDQPQAQPEFHRRYLTEPPRRRVFPTNVSPHAQPPFTCV